MSERVDLLVLHAHLFSMQGNGVGYIGDGALATRGAVIVDVGSSTELAARYEGEVQIDARGHAVLPGLIDGHMHTRYAIVRGVAQDVAHWMQRALAPYGKHLTAEAARAGTRLNIIEAMLAGTTTMGDFIEPYPGWAENFVEAGVRAQLTPTINAFPPGGMAGWALGALYPLDEEAGRRSIEGAVDFCERWNGRESGRITTMLGPQGPDMLSSDQLLEVRRLSEEHDLRVHMHVAQGDREIEQVLMRYSMRSPALLYELGLLNERLLAVHLTEATDEETDLIASCGAGMALCSGSIGIIDGIVPPAHRYRQAGGRVALGSDQASGNNCSSIFNEMKLTALFNKIRFRDPQVMPAWQVLRMATIEGAQAIGLSHDIGSLEKGKQADMIIVDLKQPNLTPVIEAPVRNIVPNLVYAATGKEVRTVIVAGQTVVKDRRVTSLPEDEVREEAQTHATQLAAAVAADPMHEGLALMGAMHEGNL